MYDFTVFNIWLLFENQWSGSLVDHGSFIIIICLTLVPVPEIPQGLIMHICKKHTHITAQSHEAVQILSPHKSAVISSLYSNNVILQHMAQTCVALQHSWSIEEDSSCFGCGCVWKATCLLDNWGGPQLPGEKHARMYPRLRCYGWNLGEKMCTAPKVKRCNVYFFYTIHWKSQNRWNTCSRWDWSELHLRHSSKMCSAHDMHLNLSFELVKRLYISTYFMWKQF